MTPKWLHDLTRAKAQKAKSAARNPLLFCRTSVRAGSTKVAHVVPIPRALKVVIVKEEQHKSAELVRLIRQRGHAARLACDRRAVLKLIVDHAADVVLLDLDTPGLDGFSLAKQLRADSPGKECFIIAMSGKTNKRCRRTSIEAGIDLMLIKPVDPVIVETLLLLECVRLNRLDSQHRADLVTKEATQRQPAARWNMEPQESRS